MSNLREVDYEDLLPGMVVYIEDSYNFRLIGIVRSEPQIDVPDTVEDYISVMIENPANGEVSEFGGVSGYRPCIYLMQDLEERVTF
jgi:hypothetical protein